MVDFIQKMTLSNVLLVKKSLGSLKLLFLKVQEVKRDVMGSFWCLLKAVGARFFLK
jgi:hypothetical protein